MRGAGAPSSPTLGANREHINPPPHPQKETVHDKAPSVIAELVKVFQTDTADQLTFRKVIPSLYLGAFLDCDFGTISLIQFSTTRRAPSDLRQIQELGSIITYWMADGESKWIGRRIGIAISVRSSASGAKGFSVGLRCERFSRLG
jgi:hypothetical protein